MNKKHILFYSFFRRVVIPYTKLKFGYKFQVAKDLPDNYIVLSNHVTDYDPILVALSFPKQMYFVASEHIARWNLAYKFLKTCFDPIIRYKGTVAASTVVEILRRVRKGANVCVFAEGVRTWDGITCPILPSTAKLIKAGKCGLVTYKIKGGYFSSPMWSGANTRKGFVEGAPVKVYTKEELAKMSINEIYEAINRDLYEDAYERQLADPKAYRGKNLAVGMENFLFKCPKCGKYDTFQSKGDTVSCTACDFNFRYNEYGMLEGAPFETIRDLAAWQKERVAEDVTGDVAYSAKSAVLSTVADHVETKVDEGALTLTTKGFKCGNTEIPMNDILDLAMHGQRAIVFSTNEKYYELIPSGEANALKFFLYFEGWKKQLEGKEN